jgi:putative Mg2+ transporter-C (MgtC) family protein
MRGARFDTKNSVMRIVEWFHLLAFLDTAVSLVAALALGALVGAERQYRQRSAGFPTNVLSWAGGAPPAP